MGAWGRGGGVRGRAEGGGGVWEVGEGELRRPAVVAGAAEATASEGVGGEETAAALAETAAAAVARA